MARRGRPVTFTDELQDQGWDYIDNFDQHGHAVPSTVGLSDVIKVPVRTLYDWANRDDNDFPHILAAIKAKQELVTFNKSLTGEYNATIAKLLLGKHGYHDKQDITAGITEISHEDWLDSLDD